MAISEAERSIEISVTEPTLLAQTLDRFQQSPKFLNYSLSTRRTYATSLGLLKKLCAERNIFDPAEVNEEIIKDWADELEQRGMARIILNAKINCARAFQKWYESETLSETDPNTSRILTKGQIGSLFDRTKSPSDAFLILIPLGTGASLHETLNLDKEDIVKNEGELIILFNPAKSRSANSFRQASVDPTTAASLIDFRDNLLPERQVELFATEGKRTTEKQAEEMLRKYGNEIGIDDLNFKSLRNTFIHNFKGSNIELKKRLGV